MTDVSWKDRRPNSSRNVSKGDRASLENILIIVAGAPIRSQPYRNSSGQKFRDRGNPAGQLHVGFGIMDDLHSPEGQKIHLLFL